MMPVEEIRARLHLLATAARLVAEAEPWLLLDQLERAETVGAVLDPTLARDAMPGVEDQKRLLRAALPLERLVQQVRQVAE